MHIISLPQIPAWLTNFPNFQMITWKAMALDEMPMMETVFIDRTLSIAKSTLRISNFLIWISRGKFP